MNKKFLLARIDREIEACKICKRDKVGKAVPGEGNPNAEIMFVGEAPGKKESETGKPFIGRSGQLLDELLTLAGIKREKVYITSPVKYLPIHKTPTELEIFHGKIHLEKQIAIIDPKLVVLMGRVAQKATLEKPLPLNDYHGKLTVVNSHNFFITYHPSFALRFPPKKVILKKDFLNLKTIIKKRAYSAK